MGVAGQQHVAVAFALRHERVEETAHGLHGALQPFAGEELEIQQHLVVARTAAMYLLAHIAQAAGEEEFHLRMHVLHVILYNKCTFLGFAVDALQLGQQRRQFVLPQQPHRGQHGDVSHGAEHIVLGEMQVHLAVKPHGEPLDALIDLRVFFPKFV